MISGKTGSGRSICSHLAQVLFGVTHLQSHWGPSYDRPACADENIGKSLLLAAILGEVDKLSGIVRVPRAPVDRFDQQANKSNWIIEFAVAFVAQIPWIENATIKDNSK